MEVCLQRTTAEILDKLHVEPVNSGACWGDWIAQPSGGKLHSINPANEERSANRLLRTSRSSSALRQMGVSHGGGGGPLSENRVVVASNGGVMVCARLRSVHPNVEFKEPLVPNKSAALTAVH